MWHSRLGYILTADDRQNLPSIPATSFGLTLRIANIPRKSRCLPISRKSFLGLEDGERRLEYRVGIERDAVDSLLDQELGELRVVARRLAADADLAILRAADAR